MTRFLALEELLDLCRDLHVGPVRDIGLLDASAQRPQTTLMGADAYPTIEMKAAALLHSIVANQPLGDGNKRLGWHALTVFLALNGRNVTLTLDEAFDLTMAVASGDLRDVEDIAARLRTEAR
ncbi:type II toxin-antitoxin system death-on-curing family toxin [Demequina muriae]|uniref:Type II toxin-antitoxin system death-on-curing family toxin n=1 Tax=Demequina muriae TaxID=3051664 RepID=A0ABT8GIQ7_9MICO|nr:type II toxin-antitoxin system death-on-curing family toxin [Demequina sp. EGI L300058]MDN4481269.1 type II toxin-antitoxin system death-on-curing family toxin [Demequina sp. EGI L300058]